MGLIEIRNEHGAAIISSGAGATLRSLRVGVGGGTHELITGGLERPLDEPVTPSGVGSFIMAPWVNRIHHGLLTMPDGSEYRLPVDSGEHAIHGTVRRREWDVDFTSESELKLSVRLTDPWPFDGTVAYSAEMDGPSFRQTLEVRTDEEEADFPAAVGWHPWFRRSLGSDEMELRLDASAQWELDSAIVPTGVLAETDLCRRLRDGARFEAGEVDDCFRLGSERSAELRWPELTLRMECSPEITHAMVYSPAESICVEPQTATVNAFQLADAGVADTGTQMVSPWKPLVASTTWSWGAGS